MSIRSDTVAGMQRRAWGFYGWPGSDNRAVGEVHYVNGWMSDQMTRLDWDIFIGGSASWTVDVPESDSITTKNAGEDGEEDQTAASSELLKLIDWTDTNVRSVCTNQFVAGQGDYVQLNDGTPYRVVSVVEKDRKKTLDAAKVRIPFLVPHPADKSKPDAPLFAVLEILEELDWLNRQARTQSRQRALINGIVAVADGFEGPNNTDFWDQWNDNLSTRMSNPDDLSPIRLSGPHELVKDGVNWIVPPFEYDDVLDRRVGAAIQRLAYGLPIPPEILLGMQAQSRATAFQVEENAYRAHIEPLALLVAQVAQDALNEILDQEVEVVPNATRLLGRRNSVEDVKWAYMEGLADAPFTREVLDIPEDAAPEADGVPPAGGGAPIQPDPSNVAADEPVTAAATEPDLSDLLSDIDFHLSSELAGATAMATERARQRLGAAARSNTKVRSNPDFKGLRSAELAVHLGSDGLSNSGVDLASQITEPIEAAAEWWNRRVGEAWKQTETLVPGWKGQPDWVRESADMLVTALATHVVDTLSLPDAPPLDAGRIRAVLDTAAGGGR